MKPQTEKYLLYGSIGFAGLSLIAIWQRKWIMQHLSLFKIRASAIVKREFNAWNRGNKKTEDDAAMINRLQKYWREGAGRTISDATARAEAWSAAFISYIMKKSGVKDFPFSASHSTYITHAIKNRKEDNKSRIKGYRINEKKVEIGDLVCYPRQSGVGYDTTGAYLSHCDIVMTIKKGEAETVGGNVSQSVSKTMVPLTTDGFVDKTKEKKGYFVIIKNKKT